MTSDNFSGFADMGSLASNESASQPAFPEMTNSDSTASDYQAASTAYADEPSPRRVNMNRALERAIGRVGWLVVVCAALSLSTWSLYYVGRHYGLPVPLACLVSASFDGAAIVCADLALKYARSHGDSGLAPRVGVFLLAAMSAYLNSQHAPLARDPGPARVLYAVPPIVAVTLFELHSRYERRGALRRAGRVAKSLPVFGRWSWLLFPIRTLRTLRRVVEYRLEKTVSQVASEDVDMSPRTIRTWALVNGIDVGDRGRVPENVVTAYLADLTKDRALMNGHSS